MTGRHRCRPMRRPRVDVIAADQNLRDGLRGRRPQCEHPAPGTDGDGDVVGVGRRRAEQENGVRRRLLDGLQQCVGGTLGQPVGVLDEHDLEPPGCRPAGRQLNDRAHLLHRDRQALGRHRADVGVGGGQHRPAVRALPAAAVLALQRGRERAGGDGAARPRRAGEQPGVGHRRGRDTRLPAGRRDGKSQHVDGRLLADHVVEDGGVRPIQHVRPVSRSSPSGGRAHGRTTGPAACPVRPASRSVRRWPAAAVR